MRKDGKKRSKGHAKYKTDAQNGWKSMMIKMVSKKQHGHKRIDVPMSGRPRVSAIEPQKIQEPRQKLAAPALRSGRIRSSHRSCGTLKEYTLALAGIIFLVPDSGTNAGQRKRDLRRPPNSSFTKEWVMVRYEASLLTSGVATDIFRSSCRAPQHCLRCFVFREAVHLMFGLGPFKRVRVTVSNFT